MAVALEIAFVKINIRRDLLRLVHFGDRKNGRETKCATARNQAVDLEDFIV